MNEKLSFEYQWQRRNIRRLGLEAQLVEGLLCNLVLTGWNAGRDGHGSTLCADSGTMSIFHLVLPHVEDIGYTAICEGVCIHLYMHAPG